MIRTFYIAMLSVVTSLSLHSVALADTSVDIVFSKDEVSIIASWYRDQGSTSHNKEHGKKSGTLPPGIAKNLERGKPLPPGIAKQYLPDGLLNELPAPHPGYERLVVDGKILLVEIATRIIHDVLTND